MRSIFPDVSTRLPALVERHNIELLSTAPELAGQVPNPWHSLEWTVAATERTRYYSRLHTRNLANGIAELLRDYLHSIGPRCLIIDNAQHADPADQEFIAVLLRRTDLDQLVVVVGTDTEPLLDPPGEIDLSLAETLAEHAVVIQAASLPTVTDVTAEAARAFVDSDCTSDDQALQAAYLRLPSADRADLHDRRRGELVARAEFSLELGAIPYHAEHGSDPGGAGVAALLRALDHCHNIGLYQAAVDYGLRGRELTNLTDSPESWWHFTKLCSVSMASLGRADEAEAIYRDSQASSTDPSVHMEMSYGTAMLYARHYPEHLRDFTRARAWMNTTIAIASLLGEPKERAFQSVFARNGLALVEVRQRRPMEALKLLEDGMARLDAELAPDEHVLHRAVLRYNRAQLFGGIGRWAEALADYQAVIDLDPHFAEHHFNAGTMLRMLGRNEEALAAYQHSLDLGLPYPEGYYNLGDTRLEMGDVQGALAAFSYVLQLDPKHVEARVNRGGLLYQEGDNDGAWSDVITGLQVAPSNLHLLCLKGSLLTERGDVEGAKTTLSQAIAVDETFAEAWAARGVLALQADDTTAAIADLTRALELSDAPDIRYNRGLANEKSGNLQQAIADYDAILAQVADPEAVARRELCLSRA
jgi:tetratricopeptide (TPR) repeat protein